MAECIHGLEDELCGACTDKRTSGLGLGGTMAGQSFHLVYAPSLRADTFLHLNRQGEHWKLRWYKSSSRPAVEIAQSGIMTTRRVLNLLKVPFVYEITYPYSSSPGGVSVTDSQYWFDEVAKVNAGHRISARSSTSAIAK